VIDNRLFLENAFVDMLPGTHTIVCGFRGDPNTKDRAQSARNWCGQPWRSGSRVPAWFSDANAYFTVSSFEPTEDGELRRRKSEFVQFHAALIDDIGTKVAREKIVLPLSTLIETSPGNYQGCYLLTDDSDSRDRGMCERLIDRMVAAGLALDSKDPGMKGVTRFARLPEGVNSKSKYVKALGKPFTTRLVYYAPVRYSIKEIAAAYRLDMTAPRRQHNVISITPALAKRAGEQFAAILEVFQRLGFV
jgi:hypothetical protein